MSIDLPKAGVTVQDFSYVKADIFVPDMYVPAVLPDGAILYGDATIADEESGRVNLGFACRYLPDEAIVDCARIIRADRKPIQALTGNYGDGGGEMLFTSSIGSRLDIIWDKDSGLYRVPNIDAQQIRSISELDRFIGDIALMSCLPSTRRQT